jgi:putative membrane protein
VLAGWRLDAALAPLAVAAVGYLIAARHVRRWPARRTVAWLAGLACIAVALASGVDAEAHRRLSAHMVQHALLTLAAPPLLLAGAPLRLALRSAGRETRATLARLARGRAARLATHPLAGWAAFAAVVLGTHLTGAFELALRDGRVHALEHAAYFWSGVLFWLPLAGAAPVPRRLGAVGSLAYLMSAMAVMSIVAASLAGGELRYPAYAAPARELGFGALGDQHAAAAVMLATGAAAALAATFAAVWPALLREERRAAARDRLELASGDAEGV